MKHSQETFLQLVKEAYDGNLQLPAFQREWKWERSKVISLYDSLRKQFPIGSFLFLEASAEYDLAPRPFEGSPDSTKPIEADRLTLDGQQRITSGIALIHGLSGSLRYFLDLGALKKLAEDQAIDYRDDKVVRNFVQEIDDGDNYMIATTKQTELRPLLLDSHLLSSTHLVDKITAQKELEQYEEKYPETKDFLRYVVVPYFTLDNDFNCPVITLTKAESLAAVTRIFATINTTGKRLTPVEIVTATLYANDINLKQEVQEYHDASECLKNMDANGEILLQTIALLAKKSPKKSLLPKTITHERFKAFHADALSLLDRVGAFLTNDLGVGLKDTNRLLPYDSILAPIAVVCQEIDKLSGGEKRKAEQKIETWFIGAALSQRYQEGVHNKQENDAKDMIRWISEDKNDFKPVWLQNVQISKDMKTASPNGAIGRLVKCLINRECPIDPLEETKVGYYDDVDEYPQEHHIWPKKFCSDHIGDWDSDRDSTEYALNLIPIAPKTNKKWDKMDPSNQVNDIKTKIPNDARRKEILEKLFLSADCIKILERTDKTRKDYEEFIEARFQIIVNSLSKWGFTVGDERFEDDAPSD
ncbi:MAG TPA: DUF262 domain-containing protein [Saprospiraceae bacterium]|nr:DUF262 domain-containing protein [Saprospiraceae bacterium]